MTKRTVDEGWLADVAARASTIDERMAGGVVALDGDDGSLERLLDRWSEKVAEGDGGLFSRRLEASGWSVASVTAVLGPVAWPADRPLPAWAGLIGEVVDHGAQHDSHRRTEPGEPLPFEALAAPFLSVARRRLDAELSDPRLTPAATAPMERRLLETLTTLAGPSHEREFGAFRRNRLGSLGAQLELHAEAPGTDLYDEYERRLLAEGCRSLFVALPSLARLLGRATLDWVAALTELAAHRSMSAAMLSQTFGLAPDTSIALVRPTSGDPHDGRSVLRVTFADGTDLAYKPRSVATQVLWAELCAALDAAECGVGIRAPKAVDCGEWGWSEWIEPRPCASGKKVAEVYRTAGAIAAVGTLIGSTDLHAENVVVDGSAMVIVDTEMLLQPDVERLWAALSPVPLHLVTETVLHVGLLPSTTTVVEGWSYDPSALGNVESLPLSLPVWKAVGTNAVRLVEETVDQPPPDGHLVRVDGEVCTPEANVETILDGFRDGYAALAEVREWFSARLEASSIPIRVVVRPTFAYALMLRRLREPDALVSGVAMQIQAEVFGRAVLRESEPCTIWPLVRSEVSQLADGYVPIFSCMSDAPTLAVGPSPAERFECGIAREHAGLHMARSGDVDLRAQEELVRASLALRAWVPDTVSSRVQPSATASPDVESPDVKGRALDGAVQIGERLSRDAHLSGDSAYWIGAIAPPQPDQRPVLAGTGALLYEGNPGIAVFLAALARVTGEQRWAGMAVTTLADLVAAIERGSNDVARAIGLGAHCGAGGTAYALLVAGNLIDEPRLIDAAARLADGLAVLDPASDTTHDVIGGAAGTILAATALAEALDRPALLASVEPLAVSLADAASVEAGAVTWPSVDDEPLQTFAHGSMGIAAALGAAAVTAADDPRRVRYERLLTGALSTLRDSYADDACAWPDPETTRSRSWCRGSIGQLLALEALSRGRELDALLRSQRARVQAACAEPDGALDTSLCCGAAGQLEYWRLHGSESPAALAAHQLVFVEAVSGSIADSGGRAPGLALRPDPSVPVPGLYDGDAGVGYALAGIVDPTLPVLAAWETAATPRSAVPADTAER